jgi:hypothetical protein
MLLSPVLLVCLASPAQAADPPVFNLKTRTFRVPVQIESRRGDIELVLLFVSTDQGKTWNECGVIGPDEDAFRYAAPADGTYWFAVQIALKNKTREPADFRLLEPALKVVVETPKKPAWETPLTDLEQEVRQLRSEVARLLERVAVLEKMLKEKQ